MTRLPPFVRDTKHLWTAAQVGERLGCTENNVTRIARRYDLGFRLGRTWIFTDGDVEIMEDLPGPGHPKKDQ